MSGNSNTSQRLVLVIVAVAATALSSAPAHAQRDVPPPELVDQLTAAVRDNLTMARVEDGSNVPAETPEERARPIVPRALEVQTIQRGELTAQMEACGLDWNRDSFRPYMAKLRASGRYVSKQMAYIGLLHGATQGIAGNAIKETGIACTDTLRAELTAEAATTQVETP